MNYIFSSKFGNRRYYNKLGKNRTNAAIKLFGLLRGDHNERIYFKHIL